VICVSAVRYTDTTTPGWAALLPTVGAALVIAAGVGAATARLAPGPLLAVAPLRCVGDRSYAFYLWHWPVLVIAAEYEGRALSLNARLVLLAIAFLLSIVSYRRVEDPIRRSRCGGQATALLWPVSVGGVVMVATLAIQASDAESLHLDNAAAAVGASSGQAATPPSGARRTPVVSTPRPRLLTVSTLPTVVAAVGAARRPAPISAALAPYHPTGCSPTTTATGPDAVQATERLRARSADSVTPLRQGRSWFSATRTWRCGFRRCSRLDNGTTTPLRYSSSRAARRPAGLPRGARQKVSAGTGGRSARCRS
jgi:hypothetical protein